MRGMSVQAKRECSQEVPVLESQRLKLRRITPEDCENLHQYMNHPQVQRSTSFEAQTLLFPARLYRYFAECYERLRDIHLAIELQQSCSVIGVCSLQHWDRLQGKARLGYLLSPEYWHQGYATEAARALIQFGFESLQLNRIEARCSQDNPASERVLQKCGLTYVKMMPTGSREPNKEEMLKLYAINRGII